MGDRGRDAGGPRRAGGGPRPLLHGPAPADRPGRGGPVRDPVAADRTPPGAPAEGVPHDAWDELADTLHTAAVPLDELHDPKRLWSLGSSDPGELRAEITRLRAELGTYRTALSRPFPVAVLHWPADELRELLTAYPSLGSEYASHPDHLARLETALRDLQAAGTPNLGIVRGTVPSYEAFAASEAASPADPDLLPQYATTLAARGRAVPWPPAKSGECWCGSGDSYRECHGGRVE